MKISKSSFALSVADKRLSDGKPQISFVGRSNVGKSSLLNMLVNNKKLARTSSTPGRTRLINYFAITGTMQDNTSKDFYFVDLPGYGFAQASKMEIGKWQSLIEPFLVNNEDLKCTCVLVDARHDASPLDKQMIKFLVYYNIPFIIIATKCDKLPKSKIKPTLAKLATGLGVVAGNIYGTSSDTGYGKQEVLDKLEQFLLLD